MVTAIVLINTHHGRINEVAEALADVPEFSEVYSVGGSYDIVGILRVETNEGHSRHGHQPHGADRRH